MSGPTALSDRSIHPLPTRASNLHAALQSSMRCSDSQRVDVSIHRDPA